MLHVSHAATGSMDDVNLTEVVKIPKATVLRPRGGRDVILTGARPTIWFAAEDLIGNVDLGATSPDVQ